MDKKELQKKLSQSYSTENWQEVVQFVFPNVQILNPPMIIPIDNDKVEQFRQLGNVQLHDGKSLALFELKLKENVNIIRNRVELNNIVSQYIDQDQTHGVLSIFEQGKDDYRFTFTARSSEFDEEEGDFVAKKTDTKRFTYVLGKNESCKTPALQFFELRNNKDLKIDDVIKAFNISKLNADFFNEYKTIYNDIVEFFTGKRLIKVSGKWEEKTTSKPDNQLTFIFNNNELEARNFVKMLLGRLVFLKFVQKKGWLGVPKSSTDWKNGNTRFLEEMYENFKHKELFYSTFLSPLFFDALNNPNRENDIFQLTDSKVPYLSGGLFDEDNLKTREINIPQKHFDAIFDFLDRYNFTIDENVDIEDKNEFSIDPEMLGHIFENLLEDNKDKGAFYTPKEIVRYMCQESLKEYLKTSLENNKQWPTDENEANDFEQALHNFVTKKEAGGIIEFEETIARALKDVKICDPAIGSGAFPMGLLNEIFQLVHKLHEANKDKVERVWELKGWQPNLVKQSIIQNSIYGVDIEKGAVDVARLRFWLSLIVDEPEPKALPHLDYKIVVGNSLVSKLDETIIDIDWNLDETQHGFFGTALAQERVEILQNISDKQKAVFDPNSDEEKLSLEIRNLKIDLLCKQLELMINNQNIPKEPKIADYQNKPKAKFVQDQAMYFETVGWQQQIAKLQKLKKQPEAPLHFFDWKLDFPEIMNEQVTDKLGFDIVIGNPPYIQLQKENGLLANLYKNSNFKTFERTGDIYSLFYEKGINLLNHKGNICYITSNKWMKAGYGKSLRQLFCDYDTLKLIDLGAGIFETATVDTNIIILKKIKNISHKTLALDISKEKILKPFEKYSSDWITLNELNEDIWNIINPLNFNIKYKAEKLGVPLKDWKININRGITTGFNDAYVITTEEKNKLILHDKKNEDIIKPLLRGKDIKRYYALKSDLWLLFIPWHFPLHLDSSVTGGSLKAEKAFQDQYPEIYQHLVKFKNELSSRNQAETGIRYEWYALQRCANTYFDDFEKEKIVYSEISQEPCFSYDTQKTFIGNTAYILTGNNLKYLNGLLNSKLVTYIFSNFYSINLGKNGYRYLAQYMENLPIPFVNENNLIQKKIKKNVEQIITLKNTDKNSNIVNLEQQIDNLVYKLYELTYDEVLVVEPEFGERMSREAYEGLKVE